jgi:hypothetical protein
MRDRIQGAATSSQVRSSPAESNVSGAAHRLVRMVALIPALIMVIGMASGCAQVMAIRQPSPIDRNLLAVGADRTVVIGVFGAPVSAEDQTESGRVEIYKYVDGGTKNSWWSKTGRIVLYTAGDVFTAWLDQIIWMPLELAFRGTEYAATVGYGRDRDGERWSVRHFEELEAKTGKRVRGAAPAPRASAGNEGQKSAMR